MAKSKVDSVEVDSYNKNGDDFLSTSSEISVSAPSSDQADVGEEPRVIKGSKSWKKDDFSQNTWGAPNQLKAEIKDLRFVLHWVRDGARSNVDSFLEQGYDFVTYDELKNYNKERMRNGTSVDSVVRVRDMVLMKLSKARNLEKKKWLKSQQVDPSASQNAFRSEARQAGVKVLEEAEAKDLPSAYQ